MPPTSRRPDRNPAGASANRSRMYNLAGHAHSSGSLLPRSTDVHAASSSTASPSSAAQSSGVDAADAPYLTNLESHFGRVTLTAPDNLLRKQAKEKKQKIRQRKAQNAQAAAAALAGATQTTLASSMGRNAMASSSNLLDSSRRYQTALGEPPVSTGLLLSPPDQHMGMRRAYSGGHTPTLASTVNAHPPPSSTTQTVVARTRRSRPSSAARDDASRPASRASGTSRPDSALSFHDADLDQPTASTSNVRREVADDGPPRSRTESAPVTQRRSHNAFDIARPEAPSHNAAPTPASASATAPQTSMHRQNVWNDITEADPDDLPPPFPEGAPRPPTPPLPPTHTEAANDAQLIGPQPHARIPDSPPPPFVSDDEDEIASAAGDRASARQSPALRPLEQPQPTSTAAEDAASGSRPSSRASSPSSASVSEDESIELTQERRAWEADIQNGLSFEVRLLREQQRRVARERAAAFRAVPPEQETADQRASAETETERPAVESATRTADVSTQPATASVEVAATQAATLPSSAGESGQADNVAVQAPISGSTSDTAQFEEVSDTQAQSIVGVVDQVRSQSAEASLQAEVAPSQPAAQPVASQVTAPPVAPIEPVRNADGASGEATLPAPESQAPSTATSAPKRVHDTNGRLMLANETRLGLPPMSAPSRPTSVGNVGTSSTPQPSVADSRPIFSSMQAVTTCPANQSIPRADSGVRASTRGRTTRPSSQAFNNRGSRLPLPLNRRPEDTLYVISAPPARVHAGSSSEEEAGLSTAGRGVQNGAADDAVSDEEDEGAESDSSIEQWLAESAAFDALRKREEEAAARLQALQEPPVSDSDEEDDVTMPGAFDHRPAQHRRQASGARNVPDPAKLALMDQALPKAPPPLVLGRSRGGAAYSDSSSESTDTDDALDQYSSSDEDDEQHRAFYDARMADVTSNDPFVNSHKSVHARNTSSAPNLTILEKSQNNLAQTPLAGGTAAAQLQVRQQHLRNENVNLVDPDTGKLQVGPSVAPTRKLSQKARGKLPDRVAEPVNARQPGQRAGDFEADTSSSRDMSEVEEPVTATKHASNLPQAHAHLGRSNSSSRRDTFGVQPRFDTSATGLNSYNTARRTSMEPLLQPLAYGEIGKSDLKDRLKELFGQPLVANSTSQPPQSLTTNAPKASTSTTQPSSSAAPGRQSLIESRRVSDRAAQQESVSNALEARPDSDAADARLSALPGSTADLKLDDSASVASRRNSSLRTQSSASGRPTPGNVASSDAAHRSSTASVLPEQRARDEALLQIAQLAASTQSKQDSLAALERLLARTARPVSSTAPSTATRAELRGQLQTSSGSDQDNTVAARTAREQPSTAAAVHSSNRLSRQGAIVRNRGPLPDPPSALSRATSTASRPVSFVNPRSSAAPLPRGRLPAITDATRHFPPSAPGAGPNVAPSWLSYIPSEERERLPAPLQPQRVNSMLPSRAPGSRVSAMISRFEAPTSLAEESRDARSPSSPVKPSNALASTSGTTGLTRAASDDNNNPDDGERGAGFGSEDRSEQAVFRRFSRIDTSDASDQPQAVQRRPPPPPTLPARRPDSNPFRRSEAANRPVSTSSSVAGSTSMDALARQIEEAAAAWSAASLSGQNDGQEAQRQGMSRSRLTVPTSIPTGQAAGSDPPFRSPRTQAMDTLTRREHEAGAVTPPSLPPKSPLMTPEQILAAGSRNGLSASIAAAQAAAFARRNGRESRSHSASSSMDTTYRRSNVASQNGEVRRPNEAGGSLTASPQAPRPLPTLPAALRVNSGHGLGISAEDGRGDAGEPGRASLPSPPPLPTRPRFRDWDNLGTRAETTRTQEPDRPSPARETPSTPMAVGGNPTRSSSTANLNGRTSQSTSDAEPSSLVSPPAAASSASLRDSPGPAATPSTPAITLPSPPPAEPSTSSTSHAPRREPSLGLTDFDLLVAQLERDGSHFESLSAIGEFLGPAKPTAATPAQLASLSVGLVECDSRRVTREGKIKQKLSCVGVRVDKCAICMSQFREGQRAVLLPCGHIFHEECAVRLLKRVTSCPVCRAPAV